MAMPLALPHYTLADLDRFPDDGQRYELVEGTLIVTPPPGEAHEVVIHRLHVVLGAFLDSSALARIVGRSAIERGSDTHLEPDLLVYPSTHRLGTPWREIGEWWLAVEVISPSSMIYDREVKAGAYLALGVPEVWLVDPRAAIIEVCRPGAEPQMVTDALRWIPPGLDRELAIDLPALFRDFFDEA